MKTKKFNIIVTRIAYGEAEFTIEAQSRKSAKKLALEAATSHSYREHDAEYKIEGISEE